MKEEIQNGKVKKNLKESYNPKHLKRKVAVLSPDIKKCNLHNTRTTRLSLNLSANDHSIQSFVNTDNVCQSTTGTTLISMCTLRTNSLSDKVLSFLCQSPLYRFSAQYYQASCLHLLNCAMYNEFILQLDLLLVF